MELSKIKQAIEFAKKKHEGQFRKFDKKPYVVHPIRVQEIVNKFKGTSKNIEAIRIAGLLHDTVEDTETTLQEIREIFGNLVASLVNELTSDSDKIEKYGKTEYLKKKLTNDLSDYGLVLKLADRLDNVSDFPTAGEKFVTKYKKETEEIISHLELNRKLTGTQKKIIEKIKEKIAGF